MSLYELYVQDGADNVIQGGKSSLISQPTPLYGNRSYKEKTAPAQEPITTAELKAFARIDGTDEDTLIDTFITAARLGVEKYTGRALIEQTLVMTMDYWKGKVVPLPQPPLISVVEVRTVSESGVKTIYSTDSYYVRTETEPGQVVVKKSASRPSNTTRDYGGYEVEFKAGYGTNPSDVPEGIRNALKAWAALMYESRTIMGEPPKEVKGMLNLFRIRNL